VLYPCFISPSSKLLSVFVTRSDAFRLGSSGAGVMKAVRLPA